MKDTSLSYSIVVCVKKNFLKLTLLCFFYEFMWFKIVSLLLSLPLKAFRLRVYKIWIRLFLL